MVFFYLFSLQNYINSRFKTYELARFWLVGKPGHNQFHLSPTLADKSPNVTGTLSLFLGLCPTLLSSMSNTVYPSPYYIHACAKFWKNLKGKYVKNYGPLWNYIYIVSTYVSNQMSKRVCIIVLFQLCLPSLQLHTKKTRWLHSQWQLI